MKKTSTILAIGSGLLLGQAQAEIESEFHVGYNSKYVFRGVDLGDDAYEYGLDFAGTCDCGLDWSAGIWGISPDGEDGNVDEFDIYGAVSKEFGCVTVSTGFTAYTYDGGASDDAEVFVGFSGELFENLEAGLTIFYGTDGILEEQFLLEGSLGYTYDFSETVSLGVGVVYGYVLDEGDAGYASDDGTAYFAGTVSVDVALSDDLTFSPYVSFIHGWSNNIGGGAVDEEVIGGASVAFAF